MAAGDFYFAINATFRFILENFGEKALEEYWTTMGAEYYAPLGDRFRTEGLDGVAAYWEEFFRNEPGGEVEIERRGDEVHIDVRDCPAIGWLRAHNREVVGPYCRHCHFVSTAIAKRAGMGFKLEGGGGTCHQCFSQRRTGQ